MRGKLVEIDRKGQIVGEDWDGVATASYLERRFKRDWKQSRYHDWRRRAK